MDELDEHCPAERTLNGDLNVDHSHCECWWDGYACCRCNAPAMTPEEMNEQGMEGA